jgi:hypothetical protein
MDGLPSVYKPYTNPINGVIISRIIGKLFIFQNNINGNAIKNAHIK